MDTSRHGGKQTILAISTYEKGQDFLREAARLGASVLLLTVDKLANADWPRESLARVITMPENLSPQQVINTVTYIARDQCIDRIVPLDEFDLEVAALLREHMRIPGMGFSSTALFRDKLAMRVRALQAGVRVPPFTSVVHYADVRAFLQSVPGPWLLKPRTSASAIGIHKLHHADEIWPLLDRLGDTQSNHLLEQFIPGDIYHCEGVTWHGRVLFRAPFKYGQPPMQTMHEGGVFTTRALEPGTAEARAVRRLHDEVIEALRLNSGVTHSEFIRAHEDGQFYFLETAARVGGAYIAEVVEYAYGVNPWVEWARLEFAAMTGQEYFLPRLQERYAGSVICLARQESPDTNGYTDPEVVKRLHKHHHAGIIVQAGTAARVEELVSSYALRFRDDFCAVLPAPDKPTS